MAISKFSLSISLMLQQLIIFFWHQQPIYAFLGYIHFNENSIFMYIGLAELVEQVEKVPIILKSLQFLQAFRQKKNFEDWTKID